MLKPIYLVFIFLFAAFISVDVYAQSDSINNTDEQGWKQGRWVTFSDGIEPEGCKAGQKIEEGSFKDNRKTGTWHRWYCNGKVKYQLVYGADKNVASKEFFENGKLKEEGTWNNVGWIGSYKYYHENGQLYYEWVYDNNGKRTGQQKYYYANGNTMFDGEWNGGKEAGVIKEYYEDGSLMAERSYNDGKLDTLSVKTYQPKAKPVEEKKVVEVVKETPKTPEELGHLKDGYNKFYNKDGTLQQEGKSVGSKVIEGKKYFYNKEGKLEKTQIIENGKVIKTIQESEKGKK